MKLKITLLVCVFTSIIGTSCLAQLNIMIGYDLSYFQTKEYNSLIQTRNQNVNYLDDIKDLSLINGLLVGAKYKGDNYAVHLSLKGKLKSSNSDWIDEMGQTLNDKIGYQFYTGSFGLTGLIGQIGLGASIDYSMNQIKLDFENQLNQKHQFNGLSNHVYLNIEIPGANNISLSIQPYAQLYWKKWNLHHLQNDLVMERPTGPIQQSLDNFGITFIFNNGPQ